MTNPAHDHLERVELSGHIIDSLLLPKVLDFITAAGGSFRIEKISIGHDRSDPSYALIEVRAPSEARLQQILADIADHGATPLHSQDARLVAADIAGAFPEGFYSTTNQRTEVRVAGQWIEVQAQEMDCGILVTPTRRASEGVTPRFGEGLPTPPQPPTEGLPAPPAAGDLRSIAVRPHAPREDGISRSEMPTIARCQAMTDVQLGELYVVGHAGVRVHPQPREQAAH